MVTPELLRLLQAVEVLVLNHEADDPMDSDVGEVIHCWRAWSTPAVKVQGVDKAVLDGITQRILARHVRSPR